MQIFKESSLQNKENWLKLRQCRWIYRFCRWV